MDNKILLNQFIQDFIQVKTDCMILNITIFIDSFWGIIATTDEEIDTFVRNTHSSKIKGVS